MRLHHKLLAGALALAGLLSARLDAGAQDFSLSVSNSPNPVVVGSTLTYTMTITNTFGFDRLNVFMTNSFSAGVTYLDAIDPPANLIDAIFTNNTEVILQIGTFPANFAEQIVLTVRPLATGSLTNQITILSVGSASVTTNSVATVTQPPADLAVAFSGPANTNVIANDLLEYDLSVTNLGPNPASSVVLSNTLPAGFGLISVTPTNTSYSVTNGAVLFSLGTLASNAVARLHLVVQPTNAGPFSLLASVGGTNISDPNLTNNTASTNGNIGTYLTNPGEVTTGVVTQRFDFLTGLLAVTVTITNTTTNNLEAVRVLASGLPPGARLYNASGTNNGNGYVLYNAPLAAGANVNLVLEFYVLKVSAFTNYTLTAFGVPVINLNAPTSSGAIIEGASYGHGGFLIKFAATIGKTYTVLYSDNAFFTNAFTAQPSIVAPATQVQWIDSGPPKTAPLGMERYYRVIQND